MAWLLAVAAVAASACTQHIPSPPPSTTVALSTPTTAGSNTYTATSASPTTTATPSPTTTPPLLQPGPHSAIADVDLPAGTVPGPAQSDGEYWYYTALYPDTVTFQQNRFATGRRYDTYGATWWNGLPPCYDNASPKHHSPPLGSDSGPGTVLGGQPGDGRYWVWSDSAVTLEVQVLKPSSSTFNATEGLILIVRWLGPAAKDGATCNRA
jgi:hypothetical protein